MDNNTSKFDLALEIETSMGENCYFEYYTDLFTHSAVEEMVKDFLGLIQALIQQPGLPVGDLELVKMIRQRSRGQAGFVPGVPTDK